MTGEDETRALRRGIRIDLVIALCALLVSACATAASFWQTHVVAQQLSSQVWPFLTISTTYDVDSVAVDISNDGLGPAIVRSAELTIDGTPYADPLKAVLHLVSVPKHVRRISATYSGISPGSVIRVGGNVRFFRIVAPWFAQQYAQRSERVDLRLCYCSLLGNCWRIAARQTEDPIPVSRCPSLGAAQLLVTPGIGKSPSPARSGLAR
ncbi:MAG TPA: hypothetical protein VGN14_17190 [Candidatus Elarobacter sp.]|jgi:hypothetical protein